LLQARAQLEPLALEQVPVPLALQAPQDHSHPGPLVARPAIHQEILPATHQEILRAAPQDQASAPALASLQETPS
jgi:hypothetical protein